MHNTPYSNRQNLRTQAGIEPVTITCHKTLPEGPYLAHTNILV